MRKEVAESIRRAENKAGPAGWQNMPLQTQEERDVQDRLDRIAAAVTPCLLIYMWGHREDH